MPEIPPQGNGNGKMPDIPKQENKFRTVLKNVFENYKRNHDRYVIFIILVLETISNRLVHSDDYATYWYPFISNIMILMLVFNNFIMNKRKYCMRKKVAYGFLSVYYFVGVLYLIFGFTDMFYHNVVSTISLLGALICLVITIVKKEC